MFYHQGSQAGVTVRFVGAVSYSNETSDTPLPSVKPKTLITGSGFFFFFNFSVITIHSGTLSAPDHSNSKHH